LSGPDSRGQGFSLVEVVTALAIISFALLSILGVLSIAMDVHRDASIDSVLSLMTESSLQELRNYNTPTVNLASGTYGFGKIAPSPPAAAAYTGYVYFDPDGQVTGDAYWTGANSSGVPTISPSTTSSDQSTEVGINMSGSTLSANAGKSGVPLTVALATPPAGTFYTCKITTIQPTLSTGPTSSMYLIKLTFSWPPGASTANQHARIVMSSISNNTN
jgi:type II secretory pathway pseudopilin PulG